MKLSLRRIGYLLSLVILSNFLSSCLLVCLTGPSQLEKKTKFKKTTQGHECPKVRVYTIRGFLDVFSTGMYGLADRIENQLHIPAQSISHLETRRLSAFLIKENHAGCQPDIVLIGHSYGGDDGVKVARWLNTEKVPVKLIVSLDHTKKQTIPPNVKSFYNLSSGESILHALIPWGCEMSAASPKTKMVKMDLAKDQHIKGINHFNIDKLPKVHALVVASIQKEIETDNSSKY